MKTISVTNARNYRSGLIDEVEDKAEAYGLNGHGQIEAVIIKFPRFYNPKVDFITNLATYGRAFDFLEEEPELYSIKDLKKRHV